MSLLFHSPVSCPPPDLVGGAAPREDHWIFCLTPPTQDFILLFSKEARNVLLSSLCLLEMFVKANLQRRLCSGCLEAPAPPASSLQRPAHPEVTTLSLSSMRNPGHVLGSLLPTQVLGGTQTGVFYVPRNSNVLRNLKNMALRLFLPVLRLYNFKNKNGIVELKDDHF